MKMLLRKVMLPILFSLIALVATAGSSSQDNILSRRISLSLKNVSLQTALTQIETEAGVKFTYSANRIKLNEVVNLEVTDKKLEDVLHDLLAPKDISFSVNQDKNTIMLSPVERVQPRKNKLDASTAGDRQASITGTVTDATTKQPMPGVSVIVKGTINGTSTGADGTYTLTADDNDVLVFSSIGYGSMEVNVGARSLIDIALEEDIASLSEVIVSAGYYDIKDKEKTGSIVKVASDIIEKQPVTNPLGALQGRMPGVFIQQTTGVPGGDFKIEIRGRNSLRDDGNEPFYIVDGVPFSSEKVSARNNTSGLFINGANPLTSINSADIESIEILKDADATAIYGSRGANGVVLITTKKGKAGKTKFDINLYNGIGKAATIPLLNTAQYLAMRRKAFINDGYETPPPEAYDINGTWDTTRYTNWQKVLIGGSAHSTSIQSSLSGGNENTQFLFGAGYRRESSVFPGGFGYQKSSVHLSVSHHSVDKRFLFTTSLSGTFDKNDQVSMDFTNESARLAPNAPSIYDTEGNLNWENSTWQNPFRELTRTYDSRVINLIENTQLSYDILPGLRLKTSVGVNILQSREFNTYPSTWNDPAYGLTSAQSSSRFSTGNNQSWIIEPQANWERKIAKGNLSVLVGSTFQEQQFERVTASYRDFPSNSLLNDLSSAAVITQEDYINSLYRYSAVFGRLNYNWNTKYIVNLTSRRDGSSRFGPGRQFANFIAAGTAWIFSNESVIQENLSFISFGKLRASYGITGSDQIGNYQYLDTYSTGTGSSQYQGTTGLTPTRLYNPDFAWETNKKMEAALELGFIKDRILLNVSYYRNRSSNQLVNYTLPMTTGFTGILANLTATVQNTGIEADLTTTNFTRKTFRWKTSLNITVPRNKLIEFTNIESSSYANTYVVGKSIYITKAYEFTGVDPQKGIYTFKDYNNDGVLTSIDDQKKSMFVGQYFYGGVNNSFQVKGLTLDVFFQFVKQDGYTYGAALLGAFVNHPAFMLEKNIWEKPGDQADIQRLSTGSNQEVNNAHARYRLSDAIVKDASFIRLKNVSLAYQFPSRWSKKVKYSAFVQAQNLFVITPYEGYDPESQATRLAPLRMVTAGAQFTL